MKLTDFSELQNYQQKAALRGRGREFRGAARIEAVSWVGIGSVRFLRKVLRRAQIQRTNTEPNEPAQTRMRKFDFADPNFHTNER